MALKLMYITNNADVALIAEKYGVDRIWVDLESLGKEERQKGMNSVKSKHTIDDIRRIKPLLTKSEMLVRINHWNENSQKEIDDVISAGADMIMLPMWKTAEEVNAFLNAVDGRCKTTLLLETKEAAESLDEVLHNGGMDEIHIGLNDLHLSYGLDFMFELLSNGTVEMLINKIKQAGIPCGFGGITLKKCRQNQALLYYSNLSVVDENLNYKFQRFKKNYVRNTKKSMLAEINVLGCTCVFNKKLLKFFADSSFESDIPHDAWIALQGMFLGKCLYDERSFILYRQHGNNGSGQVKKGKYKIQDYVKKIKELDKMQGDYEHFANEFLENYKSILNPTDKKMFEALINYRDNILIKIKLFLPFYINSYHLDKEIARRVRMMKGIL